MDLCNEKDIRALLGRHGFRFSKSMGQNFLIEGWVPRDIAEASGAGPDTGVLEIGPGIGPLTVQLARRAAKVAAIELDRPLSHSGRDAGPLPQRRGGTGGRHEAGSGRSCV